LRADYRFGRAAKEKPAGSKEHMARRRSGKNAKNYQVSDPGRGRHHDAEIWLRKVRKKKREDPRIVVVDITEKGTGS